MTPRGAFSTMAIACALGAALLACDSAAGFVAGFAGNLVGETGDSACDRRFVSDGGARGSFCQELLDTVATSQFQDDCRTKFQAQALGGRCPREQIIAGCKIGKKNEDGSQSWDWYYDVSALERDAGLEPGEMFPDAPRTQDDVKKLCADPARYSDGAEFVTP
jgi:hypothetical protein